MPLDPMVSLAVAVAEAPGSCALFVGSGVSVDAGVPTGWQVYLDGLQRLRRMHTGENDVLGEAELLAWLASSEFEGHGYSEVLEALAPDQATRRSYLASHFEGITPGPAHERIADLVSDGYVKVLVTTNFDRLLEGALAARGVDPVVVSDEATLLAAPRREHAACFILKVHGDYRQETIRNIPGELDTLESAITTELQAILDHYGIVVLGYSGSGPAIARCLRARRSRYGLWWMSLSAPPAEPAASLVEATGGRVIARPGAAEFLADLRGHLDLYSRHPSGHTPASVHDEIAGLLRRGEQVGLDEALRRERHADGSGLREWTESYRDRSGDAASLADAGDALIPVIERRLASLLPVALHDTARFRREMRSLARAVERQPRLGGLVLAMHPAEWGAWWIGYVTGALLIRNDNWAPLDAILVESWHRDGITMPLLSYAGETGTEVSAAFYQSHEARFLAPVWEYLRQRTSHQQWLRERYAELFDGDSPGDELAAMDFVNSIVSAIRGQEVVAYWTMHLAGADRAALTLFRDADARAVVAAAAEIDDAGQLGARFTAATQERQHGYPRVHFVGNFPRWQPVINLMTFGQREPPAS